MTKCCSYYGVNESVHFNNVWEMSVQISLEANDLHTCTTTNNYNICIYIVASIVQGSTFQ